MKGQRLLSSILFFALVFLASGSAEAMPQEINKAVLTDYTPAIWHHGLETAYEQPDPSKFKGFVVVEKGGIPAERARHFITWSDYDYRGAVIHVDEDDRISTRRGKPYTYLKRGNVMAIAGVKYFNRTIYLKLISADVYVPIKHQIDKRHSRVTVMLGFKFPGAVIKGDDADAVISRMKEWLSPFPNEGLAKAYASGIADEKVYLTEGVDKGTGGEDERMKNLEEKIDKARQELEEAEEELKSMKKSK